MVCGVIWFPPDVDADVELNCDHCVFDGTAPARYADRTVAGNCPWCGSYFERYYEIEEETL